MISLWFCVNLLLFYTFIEDVRASTTTSNNEEDYYWRPYTGDIPADAVPGGKDKEEKTTYIGQTYFTRDVLIPGQIDPTTKKLSYAMNGAVYTTKENVNIFCARHPEQFEWIITDVKAIRFLTDKILPQAGYDDDFPLLIGRKIWNGELVVGKVTVNKEYEGLGFVADGETHLQKDNFEVLSYNPKVPVVASNFT